MKKLYIHIGYPKTATTAIQAGLYQNSTAIQGHGYYYPRMLTNGSDKTMLANLIQDEHANSLNNSRVQQLVKEMHSAAVDNIILSSERFASFSPDEIAILKAICADFKVFIIVYVRRQDDFLQSLWSQKAKSGRQHGAFIEWTHTLLNAPDYNIQMAETQFSLTRFSPDYAQVLEKWAQTFSIENIFVRPFQRTQLHPNMLVDFLQTCGMQDTSWIPEAPQVNVTPSLKTTEVLRILGEKIRDSLPSRDLQYAYQNLFRVMQQQADTMGWNDEKPNYITRDLHDQIMAHFEESNRAVATAYLGRDQLFTEPFREKLVSTFALDQVSGVEIFELTQPALEQLLQRLYWTQRRELRFASQLARRLVRRFPAAAGAVNAAKRVLR